MQKSTEMMLVSGPISSGKSTSMAEFHELKARDDAPLSSGAVKRLVAVEGPVEYPMPDLGF